MINASMKKSPQFNKNFCDRCGAKTITNCPGCNNDIQGKYHVQGVFSVSTTQASAYCQSCGNAFPWTETAIKTAKELAQEMEDLSSEDKNTLSTSIEELIKENPKTTLAATRFKKVVAKTGKTTADGFRSILINIVSETAKKIIWPD